jgi:hypothetical protein
MPRRKTLALASAALAVALACVTLDNLSRPVFTIVQGDTLCSSTVAMDSHRAVWGERGCEASSSGWKHLRDATEEQNLRIVIAFADLPEPGNGCPLTDSGFPVLTGLRLQLLQNSGDSEWTVCGEEDGGFTPPFDEAVSAMRELGAPP